jgi:hypothetical protein
MDPTVGTFAGSIVEPIEVLTMEIHIPMEGILRIPMEDILLTPMEATGWAMEWAMEATGWAMEAMEVMEVMEVMEDIIVHPISAEGLFTNTIVGTRVC